MKTPESLDNQERDLNLTNRDPKGSDKVRDVIGQMKNAKPSAEEELQALRHRIATARATDPTKDAPQHCTDCYTRGWAAALQSLEE